MTTHHFVAASARFLTEEEPLEEVLKERRRHYGEQGKEIDFWLVRNPSFLDAPELSEIKAKVPQPSAAVVSTDSTFITFMKLRLEYVVSNWMWRSHLRHVALHCDNCSAQYLHRQELIGYEINLNKV